MGVVTRANAEHYVWGGDCDGWMLLARPDLNVTAERMPAGRAETTHHHQTARQFFYVLSGTLTMILDGERHEVGAHQGIEIPPGAPHQARNDSQSEIAFLVIAYPTTRGDRVDAEP